MTLAFTYLDPDLYEVVLQNFIAEGMSKKQAAKEVRHDIVLIATAIRDAHFTKPWNQLPDFMDPAHHIELTVMPGPNGALVTLCLDAHIHDAATKGRQAKSLRSGSWACPPTTSPLWKNRQPTFCLSRGIAR